MNIHHSFCPNAGILKRFKPSDAVIFSTLFIATIIQFFFLLHTLNATLLDETPVRHGTLHEGTIGIPIHRNPLYATNTVEKDLAKLLHSGLLRHDKDGNLTVHLAEQWSKDENKYTFTLKKNIFFHNGFPVTTDDIIGTVAMIQESNDGISPHHPIWDGVSVEKASERVVEITVPKGAVGFPEAFTVPIVPHHIWKKIPKEKWRLYNGSGVHIGAGPYMYKQETFTIDERPKEMRLVEFPGYTLGRPYIQNFVFHFFISTQELLQAYVDGTINTVHSITGTEVPILLKVAEENVRAHKTKTDRVFGMFFNTEDGRILHDPFLRTILSRWIKRESVIKDVFGDYATPLQAPIASDTDIVEQALSQEDIKQTLEDIGWRIEGLTGQRVKDEVPFSVSFVYPNTQETEQIVDMLAKEWIRLGIFTEKVPLPQSAIDDVVRKRDFDIVLSGYKASKPEHLVEIWKSGESENAASLTGYGSPVLNTLLTELQQENPPDRYTPQSSPDDADETAINTKESTIDESDESSREGEEVQVKNELSADDNSEGGNWQEKVYNEIKVEMMKDVPAAFLYSPHFLYILPKDVRGDGLLEASRRLITGPSERFADIHEWYTRKEKVWKFLVGTQNRDTKK